MNESNVQLTEKSLMDLMADIDEVKSNPVYLILSPKAIELMTDKEVESVRDGGIYALSDKRRNKLSKKLLESFHDELR